MNMKPCKKSKLGTFVAVLLCFGVVWVVWGGLWCFGVFWGVSTDRSHRVGRQGTLLGKEINIGYL